MPVRSCDVTFRDARGILHSTEVLAASVLEAAGLAIRAFREQAVLEDDAVFDLRVEVTTKTTHVVPIPKLKAWLESNSADPKTQAAKSRLR